jgi:hypothetical protein
VTEVLNQGWILKLAALNGLALLQVIHAAS